MKKFLILFLAAILTLSFFGCNNQLTGGVGETLDLAGENDLVDLNDGLLDDNNGFFVGSWLSYIELLPAEFDGTEETYRLYIESLGENLNKFGVTDLFLQVRPFCDAIYPSETAVTSACVLGKQGENLPFDFLSVIIDEMNKKDISVHGWINPLRVQNVFDDTKLSDENIAKKWLDEKSPNVKKAGDGLYLNPASEDVRNLIINTVKELLTAYNLKGIHIDDYFYPTDDESFDKEEFESYKSDGGELDLYSWRRENISLLLKSIYSTVKLFGEDKIFSVSPTADIDKNENILFADVKKWGSEEGYCDMLIPQIYFGFENESKPFYETASLWRSTVKNSVKLCAGLALYKAGKEDSFAGSGKNEWTENSDIIKRQVEAAKELGYDGICLYSATYLNLNENSQNKELQNLLDVVL